jgi:CBS domain-containing membrane protein
MTEMHAEAYTPLDISEEDVIEAMKAVQGYLDITPRDFREVYQMAYGLAIKRLFDTLKAVNIMSKPVVLIDQGLELVKAAALLTENRISGAPVVNPDGRLVGIVSEKDFLKEMGFGATPSFMQIATHCLNNKSCMISRLHKKTVGDIMTTPPITGTSDMTVGAISVLFFENKINRLPIIDHDERPIGIVTRTDLAHSFYVFGMRSTS